MDIGSLFLNIGVKGADKTVNAFTNVKKGLSETASMSLEAKAGILGAAYALERLFAASGKTGTDLTNFNAMTGESVKTLQQYQYAARQVGVSNQEVEGSFKSLQSSMTKTLLGEGAPKGLARVSLLTGGITSKDIEEYAKKPELLIQKLQQYAQKETNVGLRNETLKSFGLGDGMIASLSRNAYRPEVLRKAPTYNNSEVGQLDKANVAWSNLGNKIEMAVGHFNAKHGAALVGDISKITTQVIQLVEAFTKLTEKLHLFDLIGKAFQGWSVIFEGITSAVDKISGLTGPEDKKDKKGKPKQESNMLGFLTSTDKSGFVRSSFNAVSNIIMPQKLETPSGRQLTVPQRSDTAVARQLAVPNSAKPLTAQASNKTQTNNVNVTNNFQHPGVDPKKTESSVKQAVQQAYRQMSAQSQGT